MASVELSAIWMNAADDPSDYRSFPYVTQFQRDTEVDGQVVKLAGGRYRSIKQKGKARTWALGFQALTGEDKDWLEAHAGTVVVVRDDRGGRIFGEFFSTPFDEHRYNTEADVSLTLHEVTWFED